MNRLKELRKQKGLKQKDLAGFIGVSQSTLSEWESEKYQIDNDNLFKLAARAGDFALALSSQGQDIPLPDRTVRFNGQLFR